MVLCLYFRIHSPCCLSILFGISSRLIQHCETWSISLEINDFVFREILCVCHTFLANGQRLDYYLIIEGPAATCILCAFGFNYHKYDCRTLGSHVVDI